MIIGDDRYAGGLVAADGTAEIFDDIGEMLQSARETTIDDQKRACFLLPVFDTLWCLMVHNIQPEESLIEAEDIQRLDMLILIVEQTDHPSLEPGLYNLPARIGGLEGWRYRRERRGCNGRRRYGRQSRGDRHLSIGTAAGHPTKEKQ